MTNSIASKTITCRLVVLLSAYFMAQFDFFVVNVAAPSFERSLRAGPVALELIVGGYAFAYASGMITAGRLGDMLGHRRMFIAGVLAFTVASLLCGLAQNPAELVTARLLQGLAGAMMVPQVLGTITATFPARDRPRAIAWFGVTGGVASVSGQVFGGWLLSADVLGLGWRAIFLVNVPIGLLAAVAAWRILEHRAAQPGAPRARLDLPGAAGVTASLMANEFADTAPRYRPPAGVVISAATMQSNTGGQTTGCTGRTVHSLCPSTFSSSSANSQTGNRS